MSSDVVLTAALRNNLLSLQDTQSLIDETQLRLATGLKVNSALDNPQNFFAAQGLSNRANDLTRLLDGIGQSIRTIEEADKGVTALTSLIEQADSVAQSALDEIRAAEGYASITSTESLTDLDLVTDSSGAIATGDDLTVSVYTEDLGLLTSADISITTGDTVYDLAAAINSDATIGTGATDGPYVRASVDSSGRLKIESLEEGATIRIADGTNSPGADGFAFLGLDAAVTTETSGLTATPVTRQGGTVVAGTVVSSQAALEASQVNGEYVASATLSGAGFVGSFTSGGTDNFGITLRVDDQTVTLGTADSYNDDTTIQQIVDDINTSSLDVTASFNTDTGKIEIAFGDTVSSAEINFVTVAGAGNLAFGFGSGITGYGTVGGANDLSAAAASEYSEAFTFAGSSATLTQYRDDFNNIRSQIDDLVSDASYRGVNLLAGDSLITNFNEDRSNKLTTEGVDFTSLGLGIDEVDFITGGDVQAAIDQTREALLTVRNFGQSIANDLSIIQTRQDFTNDTINTLKAGADDLTVADQNEEGANLLALQTRQTLGVTSLSLASQSQQAVLRLF